ncbi:uncharacterized protein GJ701_002112 [Geothlypis trichas]
MSPQRPRINPAHHGRCCPLFQERPLQPQALCPEAPPGPTTHHRAGRNSHRPAPRALIPQNPVVLGGQGGRGEKFAAFRQNRRRPYRNFPSRFSLATLFVMLGGGIPVARGCSCLPAPRLGATGVAGLRSPRQAGKRQEKFERGKGRQQLRSRRHLGGWPGKRRRRRQVCVQLCDSDTRGL